MTLLPIVGRELRVAARRRGTYWMRFAAALFALLLGTVMFANQYGNLQSQFGYPLFCGLAVLAGIVCWLSGAVLTAGSLSTEKREGTLGLLFLTELRGYDVVIGKLAANSLSVISAVMAIVPILALSLLLGGVSLVEFARVTLVLASLLFFSLTAGLLASALCWEDRKALGLTLLILLGPGFLQPMTGLWLGDWSLDDLPVASWPFDRLSLSAGALLFWTSPGAAFVSAFKANHQLAGSWAWFSLLATHLWAWTFLLAASWYVPRSWQVKIPSSRNWLLKWWQGSWYGSAQWRQALRARQLPRNPFLWLASRERWKPWLVWVFIAGCAVVWLVCSLKWPHYWFNEATYIIWGLLMGSVVKVWIAVEGSQQFATLRSQGMFELLLITPLSPGEMVHGQWLALRRQFTWPLLVLLVIYFAFLWAVIKTGSNFASITVLAGILILILDALTLGWLAMWLGLTARRFAPGSLTAAWIMGLPWGLVLGFFLGGKILHDAIRGIGGPCIGHWFEEEKVILSMWLSTSIVLDIAAWWWARHKLLHRFRFAAAGWLGGSTG